MSTDSWLNKTFLETALGTEVINFEVKPMGGANENYTSVLYRVVANLKSGRKQHVVVKKLLDTKEDTTSVRETSMFARETHMYSVMLPKLSALLEKVVPDFQPLAPRHVFSSTGVLVLEDLSAEGFEMLDRLTGLDLEHCLLVMRTLGRFHAASVILHQEEPECFELYNHSLFSEPAIKQCMGGFFTDMTRLLADEVKNWPEYGERYSKKFREMSEQMIELVEEGARRRDDRFNVLTHDDLWINNILFRSKDSVRFLDFQMPHYASLGNDLQIFIGSSLTEDVSRDHLDALFKEYHSTLCDTLTSLGYKKKLITLEEVREEFKKSSLYGFVIAAVFLACVYARPDCDIPMFDSTSKPNSSIYEGSKFRETFNVLLKEFERQGAFTLD